MKTEIGNLVQETRQEVGSMKTDVGRFIQEARADLVQRERAIQQDLADTIAQAKRKGKQEVTAELVQFKKDVNEALTQAQDLVRSPHVKHVLTEVGRIDLQFERLNELTDRLKRQEKEFQKIAQAYQGVNFAEAVRRDLEQQMLQAKQTLESVQNEMKALLEEVKLQRGLLDKTTNPFVVPPKQ
jgi:exonuclease VII large subunit